jgi:peptide deformylase
MSDILTIDTGSGVIKEERVEPLPLFNENFPLLKEVIPEYTEQLPNAIMTTLVKQLKITRKLYGGIGLSANQCGVSTRVFVIGANDFEMVCINPKIIERSKETIKADEGCLSFPGFYVKITRPSWIDVEFTDENGTLKQTRLEGLTARCFEHELDHMNGILFTKYVGPVAIQMAKKKQSKILKTTQRNLKRKDGVFV